MFGALKLAGNCVAEDRATSPMPGQLTTNNLLIVANVNFWELARAIFYAKLRQQKPAEDALQRAMQWAELYGINNIFGLPIVPLTDATRGYLAEQEGERTMAIEYYNRANAAYPDLTSSRLALIALETGDENDADIEAETIVKKDPTEPTALFVLGRLADRRKSPEAATKFFELALGEIAKAAAGNPSYPLKYIEQDRIAGALAAVRSSVR
jgi:tetratricopeptide (TPR) repeat protein